MSVWHAEGTQSSRPVGATARCAPARFQGQGARRDAAAPPPCASTRMLRCDGSSCWWGWFAPGCRSPLSSRRSESAISLVRAQKIRLCTGQSESSDGRTALRSCRAVATHGWPPPTALRCSSLLWGRRLPSALALRQAPPESPSGPRQSSQPRRRHPHRALSLAQLCPHVPAS
jgi:hypothetical protein